MSSVQAKKSPARRSAPVHVTGRSDRSDGGLHAVETEAAQTSQLSAFYHAGPAVPLGGAGGGNRTSGISSSIQFKLAVGRPGDHFEREADANADLMTSGQAAPVITPLGQAAIGRMPALQTQDSAEDEEEQAIQACSECQDNAQPDIEEPEVQRKETEEEFEREEVQALPEKEEEAPDADVVQACEDCDRAERSLGSSSSAETDEALQPCKKCSQKEQEGTPDLQTAAQGGASKGQAVETGSSDIWADGDGNEALSHAIKHPGPGTPLSPDVQGVIEPGLGADLSGVRVHHDGASRQLARSLHARAFTHGQDIWLGQGESPQDLRLMAHESTHVMQQTAGSDDVQMLQRAPADYLHPEDGGGVSRRLNQHFEEEIDEEYLEGSNSGDARSRAGQINRRELAAKKGKISSDTRPDVDRPAQELPDINQSAAMVEQEAETPPDSLVEGEQTEVPRGEEGAGEEAVSTAEQAAGMANQAFAAAASEPEPAEEVAVDPPAPIMPVDSSGDPLDANPAADATMLELAERTQFFREQGTRLRAQAAEGRHNAETTRGNLAKVSGEVSKAEEGISKSQKHAAFRREAVGQAEQALGVSEEKQTQVAAGAPGFQSKSDEGKEDTGPMASEAGSLAAENAANTPDDAEAADKAREQGGKIEQVGADAQTMDSAISQTRGRADSLIADAARAAQLNTQSRGNIDAGTQQLDQLDQRLNEHQTQVSDARAQVESLNSAPEEIHSQAEQLDQQGQALIASSFTLEEQLRGSQERYADNTRAVPAFEPWEGEIDAGSRGNSENGEYLVQLLPDEDAFPAALTASDATGGTGTESTPAPSPVEVTQKPTSMPSAVDGTATASGAAVVSESVLAEGLDPAAAAEAQVEEDGRAAEPEPAPAAEGETGADVSEGTAQPAPTEGVASAGLQPIEVPDPRREERSQVNVLQEMPPWFTGIDPGSAEQRAQAEQAAEQQRIAELERINQLAGGRPISQLGAGERLGIAMRLVGQRYFGSISNIRWPGWGGLAKALLDPRSMLAGAVGGLNMILSGGTNLFSAEQWRRDPLGNLLKSAADIATGLAVILGSITALAGIVAAIMGALMLVTFGAASPVALPVISVCTTIITTVGSWTIAVGKVALVLQALSLIKNLIDAATAQTAEELQRETGEIQSDITGGFQAAMSIVGAKGAQAGIRNLSARAGRTVAARTAAGGSRALARQTARALPGAARSAMLRFRRRLATAPRRAGRRLRAAGQVIVAAPGRTLGAMRGRLRSMRDRLRRGRPNREAIGSSNAATLRQTARKHGGELRPHELNAELNVVRNTRSRNIARGDYNAEVRLPNGHIWRRNRRSRTWCRFSRKPELCVLGEGPEVKLVSARRVPLKGAANRMRGGRVTGGRNLPDAPADWLMGPRNRQISLFPGQIARQMLRMRFKNWRQFRETFWQLVADHPVLSKNFRPQNIRRMSRGWAPYVYHSEAVGAKANAVYHFNHIEPLKHGGRLFDLNNLEIVSPRVHKIIG